MEQIFTSIKQTLIESCVSAIIQKNNEDVSNLLWRSLLEQEPIDDLINNEITKRR
jgi:hypothetical protein